MNSLSNLIKQSFLITIILISTSLNAETKNTEPPFGIRHFDTGVASDFTLQDIDGETFTLSKTKGHWIFLHFWASWCGPCREEMPMIQRLSENFPNGDFEIVMVNTAEDEDTIFEFLGAINVDLNSLMDADGQVTEVWKPRGLPTTFLINPKGEVKYQAIGGREWDNPVYIQFIKQLVSLSN